MATGSNNSSSRRIVPHIMYCHENHGTVGSKNGLVALPAAVTIVSPLALPGGVVLPSGMTLPAGTTLPSEIAARISSVRAPAGSSVVEADGQTRSSALEDDMMSLGLSDVSSDSDVSDSDSEDEGGIKHQTRRMLATSVQTQLRKMPRNYSPDTISHGRWSCSVSIPSRDHVLSALGKKDCSGRNTWEVSARTFESMVGHVGVTGGRPTMKTDISGTVTVTWIKKKKYVTLSGFCTSKRPAPIPATTTTNPLTRPGLRRSR
ncbi:hypothetical protein QBC44DRAFT_135990 [Cladorrhinum sp. PSN332]|nr:hypothetical protein QBC44DRAFT_135990 [Cladorrhinum sp. PSN332]